MGVLQTIKSKLRFIRYSTPIFLELHLRASRKVALLIGTPLHGNLGDQAIALAECELIKEHYPNVSLIEVPSPIVAGNEAWLNRLSKRADIVLLHGGGFLGDLWPAESAMILSALQACKDSEILVFPQTYYCSSPNTEWISHFGKCAAECKSLTVCLREQYSYDAFSRTFPGIRVLLTPDIVLTLDKGKLQLPCSDSVTRGKVLLCLRSDKEKVDNNELVNAVLEALDGSIDMSSIRTTDTVIDKRIGKTERLTAVRSKVQEFCDAALVVTDRLHGMVFSAIAKAPCVVLPSASYKTKGVYSWINDLGYVLYIESIDDLQDKLSDLNGFDNEYESINAEHCFEKMVSILDARLKQ